RDPTGHSIREILAEAGGPGHFDVIQRVYATGEPARSAGGELSWDADGDGIPEPRVVDFQFGPLRDGNGRIRGVILEALDADRVPAGPEIGSRTARLETILSAVQDGITVQDASGRLVYANDAAARLVGLPSAQAFLSAPIEEVLANYELLDGQGQPLERDLLPGRRALQGESDPEQLVRHRNRTTGEERWSMVRAHGVRDGTGRVVMVVNAFQDLTELMRHEQRLVESEGRFRAMADTAPVMIWRTNAQGHHDWFNLPWLGFTGRAIDQEVGEGWLAGVHADDVEGCRASQRDAFAARKPFRTEFRLLRNDGEYRWVLSHGVPRFTSDGAFLGFIGSCIDVHDHVEQQRALEDATFRLEETAAELEQTVDELQEQKAAAQGAMELADAAKRRSAFVAEAGRILATSLDHETTLRSLARLAVPRIADWCTVHVVDEEHPVRRLEVAHADPDKVAFVQRLEELYPPGTDESSNIVRVLKSGEAQLYEEIPDALIVAAAQDERHLEMLRTLALRSAMVVPLRAHDRILGVLTLVATDESGRRYTADDLHLAEEVARRAAIAIHNARLYEGAEAANRAKANFLAVMSHELRTPLTAIIGNADLIELQVWGEINAMQRERVDRIKASARHLMMIIDEILSFSRLETAREEVHIEDFDVQELVRETLGIVDAQASAKGLLLSVDCEDAPRQWTTDPGKVRQILLNLAGNAIKFTDQGAVAVEVELAGDALVLSVRDTGAGIAPDEIERIFQPFT
ncbi:MAG: PAS domain-containing sensor histidine kinase, partial [Longimicrobiales bacterium]